MTAHARLDANRTAQPRTRIVHHPPRNACLGPHMPLVNPEYEDENGSRVPLTAPALVHFPSSRAGFTWCGLPLDIAPETGISDGVQADRAGVLFATNMPIVTCPGCNGPMVDPDVPPFTPSEVALAKILAAWKAWSEVGDRSHVGGQSMIAVESALIMSGYVMPGKHQMVLTDAGVFLLDRARKDGVL